MKRWYIVTTYSGYENSVKTDLERRRVSMKMEDQIYQVLIPEETVEVIDKQNRKKEKVNKLFPGYVFVEMEVEDEIDEDVWFMVRNTPKVTGFLGSSGGGTKPVPVPKDEMDRILEKLGLVQRAKLDINPGDHVVVLDGGFKDMILEVTNVNEEKNTIEVLVDIFGSSTSMEMEANQVKKI